MRRSIKICALPTPNQRRHYDLLAVILGYEKRARHLVEDVGMAGRKGVAWEFSDNQVLSYESNRRCFESRGIEVWPEEECLPEKAIREAGEMVCDDVSGLHVCVDISSATRRGIAAWIEALERSEIPFDIEVDFFYSAAQFTEPPEHMYPNVWAGPVLPSFAGWPDDPSFPSVLLMGLGHEPDRAIGAVEYIEPKSVIAFEPVSEEPRFTESLRKANESLWDLQLNVDHRRYQVEEPYHTTVILNQIVHRIAENYRPILLPFGPKIFALSMLLVGRLQTTAPVWRVSSGAAEPPIQKVPSGTIMGIRAVFRQHETA